MERLLQIIAETCQLPAERIKGPKRYNRRVSDAKMFFCLFAYSHYRMLPPQIARFLECPRTNVYHLLPAARKNMEYVKEFRETFKSIEEKRLRDP